MRKVLVVVALLLWGACICEARSVVPMYCFSSGERLPDGSRMLRDNSYVPAPLDRFFLKGLKPFVLTKDTVVKSEFKRLGSGKHPVVLHRGEVVWIDPLPIKRWVEGDTHYGSYVIRYVFLCGNATEGVVVAPISKIERITQKQTEKVCDIQEEAEECFKNTNTFAPVNNFNPTINMGGGGGGPQMVQSIPTIGQSFNTSSTGGLWLGGNRGSTFNVYAYGGNGYGAAAAAAAAASTSSSTAVTPTSGAAAHEGATSGSSGASP